MQHLTIIEQHDPYNPDVSRFAVCGNGRRGFVVLSNSSTLDLACDWIKHYRLRDGAGSDLESFGPRTDIAHQKLLASVHVHDDVVPTALRPIP